jgi:hypothetical protein
LFFACVVALSQMMRILKHDVGENTRKDNIALFPICGVTRALTGGWTGQDRTGQDRTEQDICYHSLNLYFYQRRKRERERIETNSMRELHAE